MTFAPAPSRATNNLTLMFGLVPLQVQLYKATEDPKVVERKQFHKTTGNPVGHQDIDKTTIKAVSRDDIVYKTLAVNDAGEEVWVELSDDEMAEATAGTAVDRGDVPVIGFVPLSTVGDKYLVDTSRLYQARPPKDSPGAAKVYALFTAALREREAAALFKVGLRSTARYALLLPDGTVRFLFFENEIREPRPMPEVDYNERDLDMAITLVDQGMDEPELVNDAKAMIEEFVQAKIAGGDAAPVVDDDEKDPEPASVIDLTAALEASLAAAKEKGKAA